MGHEWLRLMRHNGADVDSAHRFLLHRVTELTVSLGDPKGLRTLVCQET